MRYTFMLGSGGRGPIDIFVFEGVGVQGINLERFDYQRNFHIESIFALFYYYFWIEREIQSSHLLYLFLLCYDQY